VLIFAPTITTQALKKSLFFSFLFTFFSTLIAEWAGLRSRSRLIAGRCANSLISERRDA